MRTGVIQRILSRLLSFTVVALLVPMFVGLGYRESSWWAFLVPAGLAALSAYYFARLAKAREAPEQSMRRREGFLAVILGWMVLVTFTALAYRLTGEFPGFAHAFFESMSGFTTTGASVVTDIEGLPKSVLFMRSFSHWIGGMGIIVLSVAILPELAVGGMQLISAEASGIDSDKLAPRIAATARRLWSLYVAITVAETVCLLACGMTVFDSINHSMATIATGGFSTKNSSIASFDSLAIEIVIVLFMFVSGISFTMQYRAIADLRHGQKPSRLLRSPEVRLYTAFTLAAIGLISLNLFYSDTTGYGDLGTSVRDASFTTVSIITTTGFGTADFNQWPAVSQLLLVALMLVGGCAGSTAGGFKFVRLYVVSKHAAIQLRRLIRPRLVEPLYIGDREVPGETTEAVLGYFLLYFLLIFAGGLIMTAIGLDLVSGATASVSALNSIGPGLGSVGPTANFAHVHDAGLYSLSFGMLLGRLEIYPLLVLFTSHFWRKG